MKDSIEVCLEEARPAPGEPSREAHERALGALFAALPLRHRATGGQALERARSLRRRRALIALAAFVVLATLAVPPALALLRSDSTGTWTWEEGVPGRKIEVPKLLREVVSLTHASQPAVDPDSVRELAVAGEGRRRASILAAAGTDGTICLAHRGGGAAGSGFAGQFSCVDEEYGFLPSWRSLWPAPRPLDGTPAPVAEKRAVIHFVSGGGPNPRTVGYTTLVGVARSDVTRVVLRRQDGSEQELELNQWRGFGYSATEEAAFPAALLAFREKKRWIGSEEVLAEQVLLQAERLLRVGSLCGGYAGPCPPELERFRDGLGCTL